MVGRASEPTRPKGRSEGKERNEAGKQEGKGGEGGRRLTSAARPGLAHLGLPPGPKDLGLVGVLLEGGLASSRVARGRTDVTCPAAARVLEAEEG